MARPTLTDWFGPNHKPTREGPYETITDGKRGWSFWTGKGWGWQAPTREGCLAFRNNRMADQDKSWRAHAQPYQGYKGD